MSVWILRHIFLEPPLGNFEISAFVMNPSSSSLSITALLPITFYYCPLTNIPLLLFCDLLHIIMSATDLNSQATLPSSIRPWSCLNLIFHLMSSSPSSPSLMPALPLSLPTSAAANTNIITASSFGQPITLEQVLCDHTLFIPCHNWFKLIQDAGEEMSDSNLLIYGSGAGNKPTKNKEDHSPPLLLR